MPLPPMNKTEKEMARLVSELTGVPYDTLVSETIEDVERRNNYRNKPLDTSESSRNFVETGMLYPALTFKDLQKMHEYIISC